MCHIGRMLDEDESGSGGRKTWRVPRIDKCRGVRFGQSDEFVYCLTADPEGCGFSVRFGSSYICLHPKRGEIATQTGRLPA